MGLSVVLIILFSVGIFFIFAGVIGIFRMPNTLCRLQSSTNIATMGVMPILIGASIYGFYINDISMGVKVLLILFFLIITNPIASHVMARSASKEMGEED